MYVAMPVAISEVVLMPLVFASGSSHPIASFVWVYQRVTMIPVLVTMPCICSMWAALVPVRVTGPVMGKVPVIGSVTVGQLGVPMAGGMDGLLNVGSAGIVGGFMGGGLNGGNVGICQGVADGGACIVETTNGVAVGQGVTVPPGAVG